MFGESQNSWLGKACHFIEKHGNVVDMGAMRAAMSAMGEPRSRLASVQSILGLLYKYLSRFEESLPADQQGAFIAAGAEFSAFEAMHKVVSKAQSSLLVIDPYFSVDALFDYMKSAQDGVQINVLCDSSSARTVPALSGADGRWNAQYWAKLLGIRATPARSLHDRLIVVDGREVSAFAIIKRHRESLAGVDFEIRRRVGAA
jgi:hypothetical protein